MEGAPRKLKGGLNKYQQGPTKLKGEEEEEEGRRRMRRRSRRRRRRPLVL